MASGVLRSRLARRAAARVDTLRLEVESGRARARLRLAIERIGLTRAGVAAVVAAVLVWVAARVVAGRAMYITAYGLALAVALGVALAPRRLKLTAERAGLFPRASEGDRLVVSLVIQAARRASTVVFEERLPERLGSRVRVPVARIRAGQEVRHSYGLRCDRRGVYQVGPLVAISSDPLGLSKRQTLVALPFELLVHPRIEPLTDRPLTRQFEEPPVRPPITRPWPSGLEFFGMREYVRGDDLRRIVWRASARTGQLMVREAEQGITDKIVLVLDTDRGSHSRDGEGVSESFEAGVRAAASLGAF
ncbi:MAG: DUF58 domain-containing protein, partial [Mycobacteriales bacterium]